MNKLLKEIESGNFLVLKQEKWLQYLVLTKERHVNVERINSVGDLKDNKVLAYTCRTLDLLETLKLSQSDKIIISTTLKWSEVAKCGLPHKRAEWLKKSYNLFAHNLGSAEIFLEETPIADDKQIIYTLIKTHGLVGQYLRGEVPLSHNKPLCELVTNGYIKEDHLRTLLNILNFCVIGAVDLNLWELIKQDIESVISHIIKGDFIGQELKTRIKSLRRVSIINGEAFDAAYAKLKAPELLKIDNLIKNAELWYVEAALYDFTFAEFIKILLLLAMGNIKTEHISFEPLMQSIYYDYKGKKRVNVFKKRIIEKYLEAISVENILKEKLPYSSHVVHKITEKKHIKDTYFFDFEFSAAGEKLIDFCVEAEKSGALYEKAVIILFELFELRRDKFDRFNNEEQYLNQMNSSMGHKKILLDYIVGKCVLDIGPGSGGFMDLIEKNRPDKKVVGVDLSQNVVETLQKRKITEGHKWQILHGDALELSKTFESGSVDSIIFSSVLHELFSYMPYEGKRFNHKVIATALKSAFEILSEGGRIIIRDGIETESKEQKRILCFRSIDGMAFLQRYAKDFCGRKIDYQINGQNKVIMPVNDAMEFLYTYTWGEESYVHEVQEQFGYFTPDSFKKFIQETLGRNAKIVEFRHFLQKGYTEALLPKVDIFDETGKSVPFPDSTCIIVIEKIKII